MKLIAKLAVSLAFVLTVSGAAAADDVKSAYDECFRCYNDYIGAVNAGSDMGKIEGYAEKYRNALEKYQKLSGANSLDKDSQLAARRIDADSSAQAAGVNAGAPLSSGVVMAAVLNVRSGPWGGIIGKMKAGSKIEIVSKEGSWYKIRFNGAEAYVHCGYIATEKSLPSARDGYAGADGLKVRSGPWGEEIGSLSSGAAVEILEKKDDWYVIKYNDREGYVRAEYVKDSPAAIKAEAQQAAPADAAAPVAKAPAAQASDSFSKSNEPLIGGPVPPSRITSTFGPRELFGNNYHYGVDVAVPTGTPLRSVGDGKVVSTDWNYGGGQTITIKYANGMTSTYAHCRDSAVAVGSTVAKGQVVGHSNNTGAYTTGPHLHFAVKNACNQYVDPLKIPSIWY